ncbi:DENN domain-containing protein 1A-like protein, partial [Dinothrombium tinctorium]
KVSNHIFDAYFEIDCVSSDEPTIAAKYPNTFTDEEILKFVPQFSYPYSFSVTTVLHYSFVLTSIDSKWTFGYCRHSPEPNQTCLVLLSSLPWHDTFYKLLNHVYSLKCKEDKLFLNKFLEALYNIQVPEPGLELNVVYYVHAKEYQFTAQCADHHKIPSIPEDRNLTEFFNAVDSYNMIVIFASMLNERRILITSKKLSRLSACVQAANSLIYPMHWQHIFIPVLPTSMLDYLSAPMPFLIGVPSATMTRVRQSELGDIVILDADENKIDSPFNDIQTLPTEIVSFLKKNLKNTNLMLGDGVSRTFLKALVMLIGGYRDALRFAPGQKITFNKENFIASRPPSIQPFLERMLHLQIFQQFIEGRLAMLNEGEGFNDEFEFEANLYEDKNSNRLKTQYRDWLVAMKKEGGAIIKSMNPAVKSAYKQVKDTGKIMKDKGKQAYKDFRLKINKPGNSSNIPRSAPSSPRGSFDGERIQLNDDLKRKSSGIKKSMSGVFTPAERTMTYLRNKAEMKQNGGNRNLYVNGTRSYLLEAPNSNIDDNTAPEASSEDSEVESPQGDDFKYKPINMDLMKDLNDIIFKRCPPEPNRMSKLVNNSLIEVEDNTTTSNASSLVAQTPQLLAPPIAPPRSGHKASSRKEAQRDNLLIELDSPPDDLATLFDPLAGGTVEEKINMKSNNSKFYDSMASNSVFNVSAPASANKPTPHRVNPNIYQHFGNNIPNVHRSALLLSSTANNRNSNPSTNPFATNESNHNNNNNFHCSKDVKQNVVNEVNVHNPFVKSKNWQQFE